MPDGSNFSVAPAAAKRPTNPTVAVAFGAGGARGLAHIHVIEALDEMGIRPVAIAGSSIGAIMGAGMAAGMRGEDIRDYALATVGNRSAVAQRLWSLRPAKMRDVVGGIKLGQFNLERILRVFLPDALPDLFEELAIPLQVLATDYYGQSEVVLTNGSLYQALAASAAVPAMFMPMRMGDRVMIDGGISNPVPYETLFGLADIVIGVDVVGAPEGDGLHVPNRMESIMGSGQLMMQTAISLKLKLRPPQIFLRPSVGRVGLMDFMKARDVLAASFAVKDELKYALDGEFERLAETPAL